MYIDKLDEITNEYNNTCHRRMKTNPLDINTSFYIDFK